MKVKPKYLTYEDLPRVMAAYGMYMDPGPKLPMPGMGAAVQGWYNDSPGLQPMTQMPQIQPTGIDMSIDTNKAVPKPKTVQPHKKGSGYNAGNMAILGLGALDAMLPNPYSRQQVVQPQMGYNPYPYGTGSQALMESGGYIPGEDENNSPMAKYGKTMKAKKGKKSVYNQGGIAPYLFQGLGDVFGGLGDAANALMPIPGNIPGMLPMMPVGKHGGIIPDNMSVFSPYEYEHGGDVNGCAKIRQVGANYPNKDLMEQWLLYKNGGNVNGGANLREVSGNYPNSDLLEQWLLYADGGTADPGPKRRNPIYTSNPNDPRIRAYRDSADLYNLYRLQERLSGNKGDVDTNEFKKTKLFEATNFSGPSREVQKKLRPKGYSALSATFGDNPLRQEEVEQYERSTGKPVRTYKNASNAQDRQLIKANTNPNIYLPDRKSTDIYHKTIKPTGYYTSGLIDDYNNDYINYKYNQPVQPIEYQAPQSAPTPVAELRKSGAKKQTSVNKARELQASTVRDSEGFVNDRAGRYRLTDIQPRDLNHMPLKDYSLNNYNARIPEPGIRSMNVQQPATNYSITFPEGNQQRTTYLNDYDTWNRAMSNLSPLAISSQESGDKRRASAALKNRPMKNGGTARGGSDTTNLLEQWIPWMTGEYENGGTVSAVKAKEILRDGTAKGKKLTAKQKRYFGFIAEGGKAALGAHVGDPVKPISPQEKYYQSSARLSHYKDILNEKLKAKNPQGFKDYFKDLMPLRIAGKTADVNNYIQNSKWDDYLSADEVRGTLGDKYNDYLDSIRSVNSYNKQQGLQPLYGSIEGEGDMSNLNYGRRFASLILTPTYSSHNQTRGTDFLREYKYNPKTDQVDVSETGDLKLRPDYLPDPSSRSTPAISFKQGGVLYDDGGQIDTMWGGNAELESYNPYDGGTIAFNGASHDNGGIGMQYNGNPIEVEGGEFASRDNTGNLHIYGNMNIPGTKTKFKSAAKALADKEKRYDYLKARGSELVNNANPADKFEQLTFNSGRAMMEGGNLGQADIAAKKEKLSALQRAMLDTAREFGMDPQAMSKGKVKKARGGASLPFYQDGGDPGGNDPTRADRNNNPGNIKYGKFAKKYGAKADKDGFAIFPDRQVGLKAMKDLLKSDSYKNLSVKDAIHKWTDKQPYRYNLGYISDKKVSELDPEELEQTMSTMQRGEGTRYGVAPRPTPKPTPNTPVPNVPVPRTFTPYDIPEMTLTPEPEPRTPGVVDVPPIDELKVPPDVNRPSNVEPLHINQLLGEIYATATNKVEPVPAQRYEPQLYQPYQMSMQDQLNRNEQSFNAAVRGIGPGNPSALGALAAQKYAADSQVKAEEFRTNQAIANDITNKNIALVNDAQMKNLALADTQMVRQSEARSKTRQLNQMTVNSLSSKYAQNEFENKRLAAYENLYDYRFVPTEDGGLKATYFGPNAMFNFDPKAATQRAGDTRTVSRYDKFGNLKGYTQYDDYDLREQQRAIDLEMKRRKLPLMGSPKLD
jgi:hypothetical protein